MIEDLILPELHPAQQHMLDNAKRFNVASMGRRFGKSVAGLDILIDGRGGKDACLLNGDPVAWFAPNGKLFAEIWNDAKKILAPIITADNKTDGRIDVSTGGHIDFWTLHNSDDPARGRKYGAIVVDEAAMANRLEIQWQQAIRATLADLKGTAWFLSTPKGQNYFTDLFNRCNTRNDWASFNLPTNANPYIDPAEIEDMRLDMTELEAMQEIDAQFVTFAGTIIDPDKFLRVDAMPADTEKVRFWDIAVAIKKVNDESAGALCGLTKDNLFYIDDIIHGRHSYPDLRNIIIATAEKDGVEVTIGIEEAGQQKGFIDDLQRDPRLMRYTIKGIKPDGDKTQRANRWYARAEQGHVHTTRGDWNTHFNAQCAAFTADDTHKHDDLIDAVSGGWQTLAHGIKHEYKRAQPRRMRNLEGFRQ